MVVEAALAGTSVRSLCVKGDSFIMEEIGKIFKKEKEMKKGQPTLLRAVGHAGASALGALPNRCRVSCRNCFSNLRVCQQLRVPFLAGEERPRCDSERRGSCQNVSCEMGGDLIYFISRWVFSHDTSLFLFFVSPYSDLGVHVDGFISNVAHSLIVGVTKVCHESRVH